MVLDQFANTDNSLSHYNGTGPELWEQTGGRITHFISSMGTTGMLLHSQIAQCLSFFVITHQAMWSMHGRSLGPEMGADSWPTHAGMCRVPGCRLTMLTSKAGPLGVQAQSWG